MKTLKEADFLPQTLNISNILSLQLYCVNQKLINRQLWNRKWTFNLGYDLK